MVAIGATTPSMEDRPMEIEKVAPLDLAEAIIRGEPNLLILDLRGDAAGDERIPGSYPVMPDSSALKLLSAAASSTRVVVYDEEGVFHFVPESWPRNLSYEAVRDGYIGWHNEVLMPIEAGSYSLVERQFVERQNQIAGFFSGVAVQSTVQAPPPAMSSGGEKKKKKSMGC